MGGSYTISALHSLSPAPRAARFAPTNSGCNEACAGGRRQFVNLSLGHCDHLLRHDVARAASRLVTTRTNVD
jgi:hypothetical protein